jgi:hypothetical protein
MSYLPRILSAGARPWGNDPLSQLRRAAWDWEIGALVLPLMQEKMAQQSQQEPTEVQPQNYDRRRLTQRGFVD